MDDHVESFGKINRHGHRTVGGSGLVKAPGDLVGEGEEGSGGGPVGTETVLSGGNWEVAVEFWKQEPFQNFDSGAEEGDGSVAGAKPGKFAGLKQGDDGSGFPDGWDVGVIVGEVV